MKLFYVTVVVPTEANNETEAFAKVVDMVNKVKRGESLDLSARVDMVGASVSIEKFFAARK